SQEARILRTNPAVLPRGCGRTQEGRHSDAEAAGPLHPGGAGLHPVHDAPRHGPGPGVRQARRIRLRRNPAVAPVVTRALRSETLSAESSLPTGNHNTRSEELIGVGY